MKTKLLLILAGLTLAMNSDVVGSLETSFIQVPREDRATSSNGSEPLHEYDPARDAAKDIEDAIAQAQRTGKRVLLEVGGKWCGWCHTMHRFYEGNPALLELREKNYVTVLINFSRENENKNVLSRFPEIKGYPHLFVLGANGNLLCSKETSALEQGKSYNLKKFSNFLKEWAPGGKHKSR